jgi:hypothetical protein
MGQQIGKNLSSHSRPSTTKNPTDFWGPHLELVTATFSTFCVARCHHIYGYSYDPASRFNWQKMACVQIFHQVRTTTPVACIRFIEKAINGPWTPSTCFAQDLARTADHCVVDSAVTRA